MARPSGRVAKALGSKKKRKTGKGRNGGGEKGERKRLFEEQLTSYIHLTENYEF